MRRRGGTGPLYPRLLQGAWIGFGLPAVVLLGFDGAWPALWRVPPAFGGTRAWLGVAGFDAADRGWLTTAGAIGITVGGGVLLLVTGWRAWRGRGDGTLFGDARTLLPADPRDYGWAALLAVTAGVTEEAFFRLLLPLLTAQATGSAALGFAGATLLFGWAHRYQGWRGVAATTVGGAAMTVAYLALASLPTVMVLHAVVDLNHLVARPALRRWVERLKSSPGRGGGPPPPAVVEGAWTRVPDSGPPPPSANADGPPPRPGEDRIGSS